MQDDKAERHRQVLEIKQGAKSINHGRSYLLPGLWAWRLAAGYTQRQLAERIGSNQTTVRELECERRRAYPKTIRKLCAALDVTPEALLCGGEAEQEEARQ
jgi:DNA-binding XRE family transcriptional regulator